MTSSRRLRLPLLTASAIAALLCASPSAAQGPADTGTPKEMVATYNTLADSLLALKATEKNLVRSILAAARAHGEVQLARAKRAMSANDAAGSRAAIEGLAAAVAQLATEGDNSVAAVRKRLVEGGQHHNAAGEAQGIYDEGYVIVTRAAKQRLLDSSRAIAKMAASPNASALEAEWKKVEAVVGEMK
jgi:hypothetical protein